MPNGVSPEREAALLAEPLGVYLRRELERSQDREDALIADSIEKQAVLEATGITLPDDVTLESVLPILSNIRYTGRR